MSERIPRVVGGSDFEKSIAAKFAREQYQFQEFLKGEREKTPEELAIIHLVQEEVDKLVAKYGGESIEALPEHVHVIQADNWEADPLTRGVGDANSIHQRMRICEQPVSLWFMHTVAHEMIHFKSHQAWRLFPFLGKEYPKTRTQIKTLAGKIASDFYYHDKQTGLMVSKVDGPNFFGALNEAVTEWMAIKVVVSLQNMPLFETERNMTATLLELIPEEQRPTEVVAARRQEDGRINVRGYAYVRERKFLDFLIEKIAERNPAYANAQEVFDQFAKLYFTGEAGTFLQVIDKTFGPGTLRKIAACDSDVDALWALVQDLE